MFKNVRIKTLITSTIGLLLCFILLLGIISLYYIKTLSQTTQTLYDKPHTNLVTMYQLKSSVLQASDNLKEAYFNKKKVDSSTENIINSISDFLDILETNKVDPKAPRSANMEALMQASEQWSSSAKQFLDYLNSRNTVEAARAYNTCNDLEKGVIENLDGIIETASTNAAKFKADAMSNSQHSFIVMIIFCIFVFIVAIIALGINLKSIHHPMNIILNSAKKISDGNLDFEIEYDSKNEFGELAFDFKIMKDYLKQMVKDIDNSLYEIGQGNFDFKNHMEYVGNFTPIYESIQKICTELSHTIYSIHCASDQVASGSGQMSAGAQALAQGATEQASSIEELCGKIRTITNQIEENTGNAEKVNNCVHETSEQAEASKQKMETMIKAMSEISDKADRIEHIIKTIEDIAFQTNILALNAAVEAARAGQAGKGFAVVADEVRNLASKSADAAHDTTALISETIQSVENGNAIADETAHSLLAMVEATHQVSSIVKGMSSAFKEQEEAAEKVMEGIEQISSVVQTNSATAEESAAASEQLFSQATVLKDMAAKFCLKEI